jgi:hypothetical protein
MVKVKNKSYIYNHKSTAIGCMRWSLVLIHWILLIMADKHATFEI